MQIYCNKMKTSLLILAAVSFSAVAVSAGFLKCPIQSQIGDWTIKMDQECRINVSHPLNPSAFISDREIV